MSNATKLGQDHGMEESAKKGVIFFPIHSIINRKSPYVKAQPVSCGIFKRLKGCNMQSRSFKI